MKKIKNMQKIKNSIILGLALTFGLALQNAAAATDWASTISGYADTYNYNYENAEAASSLVQNAEETASASLNYYSADYKTSYEKANDAYSATVSAEDAVKTNLVELNALKTKIEASLKEAQAADSGATAAQISQLNTQLTSTKASINKANTELETVQAAKEKAATDRQEKGVKAKMVCEVGKVCVELIEPIDVNGETVYVITADAEGEGAGGGMLMLQKYASVLYRYAAGILGFIAVMVIVISGIQIMTSAAGGSEAVSVAKDRIEHSLMGLVLLFLTALLLYTVNPVFFSLA